MNEHEALRFADDLMAGASRLYAEDSRKQGLWLKAIGIKEAVKIDI